MAELKERKCLHNLNFSRCTNCEFVIGQTEDLTSIYSNRNTKRFDYHLGALIENYEHWKSKEDYGQDKKINRHYKEHYCSFCNKIYLDKSKIEYLKENFRKNQRMNITAKNNLISKNLEVYN